MARTSVARTRQAEDSTLRHLAVRGHMWNAIEALHTKENTVGSLVSCSGTGTFLDLACRRRAGASTSM